MARNLLVEAKLLPGGGAIETELAARLVEKGAAIEGVKQWPYKAIAAALEVIPRTLIQNCGVNVGKWVGGLREMKDEYKCKYARMNLRK